MVCDFVTVTQRTDELGNVSAFILDIFLPSPYFVEAMRELIMQFSQKWAKNHGKHVQIALSAKIQFLFKLPYFSLFHEQSKFSENPLQQRWKKLCWVFVVGKWNWEGYEYEENVFIKWRYSTCINFVSRCILLMKKFVVHKPCGWKFLWGSIFLFSLGFNSILSCFVAWQQEISAN